MQEEEVPILSLGVILQGNLPHEQGKDLADALLDEVSHIPEGIYAKAVRDFLAALMMPGPLNDLLSVNAQQGIASLLGLPVEVIPLPCIEDDASMVYLGVLAFAHEKAPNPKVEVYLHTQILRIQEWINGKYRQS